MRSSVLFVFGSAFIASAFAAFAVACGDDAGKGLVSDDASVSYSDGSTTPPGRDGSADANARDAGGDANTQASVCAVERTFRAACGQQLTCGDAGFDIWCPNNDSLVNSEAYRAGVRSCFVAPANCDPAKRNDCMYKSYGAQTPTTAQTKLVTDYCATCAPQDAGACRKASTTYDPDAGPAGASDIFVAAWELGDSLVGDIDSKCTGAALDGGPDASCAKAFADCAGGLYVDRLPNCP